MCDRTGQYRWWAVDDERFWPLRVQKQANRYNLTEQDGWLWPLRVQFCPLRVRSAIVLVV